MTYYNEDRSFTNFVHRNLALPIIYQKLDWVEQNTDPIYLQQIDIDNGIDYIMLD